MDNEVVSMPTITLGWELEAVRRAKRHVDGLEIAHDGSVRGEGLEYRVKRENVFNPTKSLAILRNLATDPYLQVDGSCGFHVHLGLGRRTRKIHPWAGWFVTLARELEKEAFACVPESRRQNRFCQSWTRHPGTIIAKVYSSSKSDNRERYNWVNPVEIFRPGGIRTIEVRLMGECKRYTHLIGWISVCRLMAMSAWTLIFDPSRLEEEKQALRKDFMLLRDTCMNPLPSREVARNVLSLCNKARLIHPFGNPLSLIKDRESEMAYMASAMDADRSQFLKTIRQMKRDMREARARIIQQGDVPLGVLAIGDTVRCIQPPSDGNLTPGNYYRVRNVSGTNLTTIGDNGDSWNVPFTCVRLVESARRGVLTPA